MDIQQSQRKERNRHVSQDREGETGRERERERETTKEAETDRKGERRAERPACRGQKSRKGKTGRETTITERCKEGKRAKHTKKDRNSEMKNEAHKDMWQSHRRDNNHKEKHKKTTDGEKAIIKSDEDTQKDIS